MRGFHKDIAVQVLVNGEKAESLLTRNAGDNTLWIAVTAPVTAKIQVQISGSERIHDNSDVTERCIRLLDRTQCLYDQKTAVLEWIQDTRWDLRERLLHVGAYKLNIDSLASAIVELLTLTEDKFLGSQIPD